MSPNAASVACTSFLATGCYNLDSSRFGSAPLNKRSEGWTEAWGASDLGEKASTWMLDEESVASLLATPHPQLPVVLTQFRPAWFEQLLLRMANIPHIVLNSNSVSNEATGPLPYLRDHDPSKSPALVGCHDPAASARDFPDLHNSILDYLSSNRGVNWDSTLTDDHQRSLSKSFIALIKSEIQQMLKYLRFEDDDAWNQIYVQQYMSAATTGRNVLLGGFKGRFQASMDRAVERRRLIEHSRRIKSIEEAVRHVRAAMTALENQLRSHDKPYLLGNGKPSLVDALAWASLADCICDVHLVVELAGFPRLITYFKHVHAEYFGTNTEGWSEWNRSQNISNAFNQLPIDGKRNKVNSNFRDAIDLMQTLSLQNGEIQEVLNAALAKRMKEPRQPPTNTKFSNLYRWRMGDDFKQAKDGGPETEDNSVRKKLMRDQIRNDQVWISGVMLMSAVAILLLQSSTAPRK